MKARKAFLCMILCAFITCIFAVPAHADMGPKPEISIYVSNAPDELYYLDLLTKSHSKYDNLQEREKYNQDMLKLLYSYKDEGWYPAYVEGTGVPLWGNLIGRDEDGKKLHTYGYYGLPGEYRIIIVSESGKVSVSETIAPVLLQSSLNYDYETGKITSPSPITAYLIQFAYTCIPTLLIELLILIIFRFKIKENFKVFVLTNLATQVFLTASLGTALIFSGYLAAGFFIFPIEAVIIIAEALVYRKRFTGKSKRMCTIYAVVANLATWAIGFFTLTQQYDFILKFL